jgi:hypothetical protein
MRPWQRITWWRRRNTPDPRILLMSKADQKRAHETVHKPSLPLSPFDGNEARQHAIWVARHPDGTLHNLCLRFVRECWALPPKYETAREAWENAVTKHEHINLDTLPISAPVFTRRKGSDDEYWHVFIAGGWYHDNEGKRVRVFRSTDIRAIGDVDSTTLNALLTKWGHEIVGWTADLNGYRLDF